MIVLRFFFVFLFVFTSFDYGYTQSSRALLKTVPYTDGSTPDWAKEMYKKVPNVLKVDKLRTAYYITHAFEKSIHTQNYKHWRPQVEPYLAENGKLLIPSAEEQKALRSSILTKKTSFRKSSNSWRPLGPFDTFTDNGGTSVSWQANVYTIDQCTIDPNIIYVGTESGGIFKSIDKGENWIFTSVNTAINTVSTIKVSPFDCNHILAGDNSHIYQSVNGGANWTIVYTENDLGLNDIAFNTNDKNIMMAGGRGGLYRSSDMGNTWIKQDNKRIWDIEVKPDDASVIYILQSNDAEKRTELWKSIDSGLTFTIRDAGWYSSADPDRINGGGRMTVTPADPNRIYTILVGASKPDDHGFIGVYRSNNAGESWTLTDPPIGGPYSDTHPNLATLSNTNTLQQGYYNLGIAASHEDADVFFVGCLNLWKSVDAGSTFEVLGGYRGSLPWLHPDQQEIEINGTDIWLVNDGGINYSSDVFKTHTSKKVGLNASNFWGFGSGWNQDLIVGGRYHNGNTAHRPAFGSGQYLRLGGGEASTGYVQPGGDNVAFFSDISSKVIPQQLDEAVVDAANLSLYPSESYFASNYSELEFDPNYYSHMWLGRENKLYKSENNGNSFNVVKSFGSSDHPVFNFEISRVDNKVMYVYQRTSFYGAILHVTRDGETWETKSFPNAGSQRSGALAIHSQRSGTIYVSFAHQTNDGEKIFRSDDYGDTWVNMSDPILDGERVHCIFHQAGTDNLFAGTDYGVYMHDGTDWAICPGLPSKLETNRFAPYYKDNKLRVATYSNGVWEVDMPTPGKPIAQPMSNKQMSYCARDTFYLDDYSVVEHDAEVSWAWTVTPDPLYISDANIRNPKVVLGAEGEYKVTLKVTNSYGTDTFVSNQDWLEVRDNVCAPDIYPEFSLECFGSGPDMVQIPDMGLTTEAYTMTAWIKPDGIQPDYTGIFFNDGDSYGLNFTSDNQLGFHHQGAGSAAWAWQSGVRVEPGVWSYVALVIEPTGATVYLNGLPVVRELDLEAASFNTMKIGSYKGWGSRNYKGSMDEVTLWNKALTENEIRQQRHITKTAENTDGLIAYYQFNDPSLLIHNRVGLQHGVLRGMARLGISEAPVGGGTAHSWIADDTDEMGPFTFVEEDVILDGSLSQGSNITISQLQIPAQNIVIADPFPSESYWIVNRYGVTELSSLSFINQNVEATYEDTPENIELYVRPENQSGASFSLLANANEVVTGSLPSIHFEYGDGEGHQLLMRKRQISSTNEKLEMSSKIFPNPALESFSVDVLSPLSIVLYNNKGQVVMNKEIKIGDKIPMTTLPSGSYNYVIKAEGGIRTGVLIKGE